MNVTRTLSIVALAALSACSPPNNPNAQPDSGIPAFRGLLATPRQLAFTCVVPGCDSQLSVKIQSNVNRRVAIKRVVLSTPNPQYTLEMPERAPFILGAASAFTIDVRFLVTEAPKSETIDLLVTYTDASGEESPDRIEPGELKIPLVKRLVGEPLLAATPQTLNFGVVQVSSRKELPVTVKNVGFGNIALEVDGADAGTKDLTVTLPTMAALIPDAGMPVPFVYAPSVEGYLKTEVELTSSTPNVEPIYVAVEGTSYSRPRVVLEPEERALDFGEIPKNQVRRVTVQVANVGGETLDISSLSADDPSGRVSVSFAGGLNTASIEPLKRLDLEVEIDGMTPGQIEVPLRIVSNDPARGTLEIPIRAVITEPKIQASPGTLDWGTMPQGWVVTKEIELRNVGYGSLTIKGITFVGGTSNLYSFRNLPAIPTKLARNERVAFEVEFRAQSTAMFGGSVSIETDDPVNPFSEVTLSAVGGSCSASCPIINGTPSCTNGTCTIGSCNTGYYDTDVSAANGCECREIGTDPGGFCSTGVDKGTLADNGSSANHTGIIHSPDDEDYIRFFGADNSQVFSDDYDVNISLSSSDPNITMCVSRYDTSTSVNECYTDSNKTCGIRSYRRDGSYGREDGAMYYIKVYRTGTTATCTSYTVYMRNG